MKIDVILMNPPYNRDLHLKFLEKAIEVGDNVVSVQPCLWAKLYNYNTPKGQWRKRLNGILEDFEFISHNEANEYFGTRNAIEDLNILYCTQNGTFDIENYGFDNENFKNIIKKIDLNVDDIIKTHNKKEKNDNKYIVKLFTWHKSENCYDACIVPEPDNRQLYKRNFVEFDTELEKQNFLDSLKTNFMDFFYYNYIIPSDCRIYKMMFRMKDYTEPWTDKRFCDFFGITGYISDTEAEPNSEWAEILKDLKKHRQK